MRRQASDMAMTFGADRIQVNPTSCFDKSARQALAGAGWSGIIGKELKLALEINGLRRSLGLEEACRD
jgi:hypothetical protein